MSSPSPLSRVPVLRTLVPFGLGILVQHFISCWWAPVVLIGIAIGLYAGLARSSRTPQGRLRWRSHFILPLAMAAFSLGWLCAIIHSPAGLDNSLQTSRIVAGRVVDLEYTDFSMRMTIDVLDDELPSCRVLLSTRGCDYTMRTGDLVAWQADLREVGNMGNPGEMDYKAYLIHQGIRYQQHLPVGQIKRVGHSPTFMTRMAQVRRGLRLGVFQSRLSVGAQQFVAALLLGDSRIIDKTTRQEFSAAGIAHVLALSGLHVGFIALIIWWLLFPLDYMRLKKLRLVITLVAIGAFAIFTGLSPSVIRATVMIGMVFASFIFYRRSMSMNALALAALMILVFSPSSIYSVGFQLSFVTVGAVLMFARLPESLTSRHKWLNAVTSTAFTSLVAMLATVALSAHYFHTVSLMSVVSNLLVLPILPLFMAMGALFLLVTSAGMHWPLLDCALDATYGYIRWVVTAVNSLPLSHVTGVYVSTFGVIAYFVIMALVVIWIYRRNYRYLLWAGCVLALLLAHSLWIEACTPRQEVVIFNAFTSTPVLYHEGDRAWVWVPDEEDTDSATFSRYYAGFLARHGIDELQFVSGGDSLRTDHVLIKPGHAVLMGHRILAVGSGRWKHMTTDQRLRVDDIIVTKRYHGTAAKLQELYRFDRLVVSGALQDKATLLHECDSLEIPVHDLATHGALVMTGQAPTRPR